MLDKIEYAIVDFNNELKYIKLPDGSFLVDKNHIDEFKEREGV